jgi:peptide subunit release factor 1 (eRF1)
MEIVGAKFGLVWCIGDDLDLYEFYANFELKKIQSCSAHLKNKHGKGGQSQKRFERIIDGQRNDYFNHVAEVITATFPLTSVQRLFIVGNGNKQSELWKRLSPVQQAQSELVVADGSSLYDVLKTLNLNLNTETEKYLTEFYNSLHVGLSVYGKKETQNCLQSGQLKLMFSTSRDDETQCSPFQTQHIWVEGKTSLEQRFIKEFGGCGGLTRWKIDEYSDM